jgi:hypothetical protein
LPPSICGQPLTHSAPLGCGSCRFAAKRHETALIWSVYPEFID